MPYIPYSTPGKLHLKLFFLGIMSPNLPKSKSVAHKKHITLHLLGIYWTYNEGHYIC